MATQQMLDPVALETAAVPARTDAVSVFERLAMNPGVDVEKLQRLIDMQKEILTYEARKEFSAAFAAMQGELPSVTERGEIVVNGQVRSKYARNEDIQDAIRPVLQRHGFALSFRNKFADGLVTITGILSHRSGHSEQDEFVAKADTSGSKNDIQALGSTRSYGQRYCTVALLNITTRDQPDDDGQKSQVRKEVTAPDGFSAWLLDMEAVAAEGTARLTETWNKSKAEYRAHLVSTNKQGWEQLKRKAAKAQA